MKSHELCVGLTVGAYEFNWAQYQTFLCKLIQRGNWNRNCLQGWDRLSFLFARAELRQTSVWSHLWSNRFLWVSETADCEAMASRSLSSSSSSVAERWNLEGKTALVTGGTRGLGWVICPWMKRLEFGSFLFVQFLWVACELWVGADGYIQRWGLGGHFLQVVFELHR